MNSLKCKIGYLVIGSLLILFPLSTAGSGEETISLTKEEKETIRLLNEEDQRLLSLSEDEQVALALKNSSVLYGLKTDRDVILKNLWAPSLRAEYGHEITDRDRLDAYRRGQEEATYWIEYDFMRIFDNIKMARSQKIEKETDEHKIRCDVRELRGKIQLTKQKVEKCCSDYICVQENYKELEKHFKNPPDKERLAIQHTQDTQRLYLTRKDAEQELLGYQYTLLSLLRGYTRIGYIR